MILNTVGDNPLTELMELDEFYCWTARIRILESVYNPKKRSKVPYIMMASLGVIAVGLILLGTYLYFYY